MSSHVPENPLVLHLDATGHVWSQRAKQSPRRTRLTVTDFINYADLQGRVHVIATPENVPLIVSLWKERDRFPEMQLHVGTPRMIEHTVKIGDALSAAATAPPLAPSLGGWHPFTDQDAISYELASLYCKDPRYDQRVAELAKQHPVWPLVGFISTINCVGLGYWLGAVRDPRWYVNPKDPNSTSPMEKYLGLWPKLQHQLILDDVKALRSRTGLRCAITKSCWLPATDAEMAACDLEDPRNFLLRILVARCPEQPAVGIIRASQVFTRFVRALWLSQLSGWDLFDPREFLRAGELDCFTEFAEALAR